MGSFNATCHLSGLKILDGDSVIALPVSYSHINSTTSEVYHTSDSADLFGLAVEGEYNDYGAIKNIDPKNEYNNFFLEVLNKSLLRKNWGNFEFINNIHAIFAVSKNENDSSYCHGEFLNDIEIQNAIIDFKTNKLFKEVSNFSCLEDFFKLCRDRSLFYVNGSRVHRLGFILIKKSIFEKMLSSELGKYSTKTKEDVFSFCQKYSSLLSTAVDFKNLSQKEFFSEINKREISDSFFHFDLLNFKESNSPLYHIISSLSKYWEENNTFNDFITPLTTTSLINIAYSQLGKTFYPNCYRSGKVNMIRSLCDVISAEIDEINAKNLKSFLFDGYDIENNPDDREFYFEKIHNCDF